MSREVSLDGEGWQLRGCLGRSWQWYVGPGSSEDGPGWLAGRVPGSVQDDLWRAGEVEDLYHERNSLRAEWAHDRAWVYRRWLQLPAGPEEGIAVLRFEGVDHRATVFVDGHQLAEHEGVFIPFEVDIPAELWGGRRLLSVVVHPAPENQPQVGDTRLVRVHKARMGYGWDFCPRMVNLGIWRGVTLHLGARPYYPWPRAEVSPDGEDGTVRAADADRLTLWDGTRVEATGAGPELVLRRPELWWPNGSGRPHCYTLEAEKGEQSRRFNIGFRALGMAANPGGPPGARPYTVVVNGRPLFIRGWNWVPVDALYGALRPGKLAHLLGLAAWAGANLLRVWGGGLLETPEFYNLCDKLGLLVWQEFSLSSSGTGSVPSDAPEYVALMAAEAPVVIGQRRHHPSLALWCGGNELAEAAPGRDDIPLDESTPVLGLLARAVAEHDPGRPFLPTSPSGPRFLNRLDIIEADPQGQHDVHGPWEHQGLGRHNVLYDAGMCLLHSEVGVEGMANRRGLERLISPGRRWPAGRSNPVYEHLGAWWDNEPLVQESFGGRLSRLDLLRRASQHLQADGLRYVVESRLRKAPRTSGVLPWQFNEAYPNAWCTAVVDYWGEPKPAYYGVKRAYRPRHVCASFETWAWGGHAEVSARIYAWPGPAAVSARFVDLSGGVAAEAVWDLAGDTAYVGELRVAREAIATAAFVLDLGCTGPEGAVAQNRYLMSVGRDLSALLDVSPAAVQVSAESEGVLCLRHTAGPAAIGLTLEDGRPREMPGWAVFDDNVLHLLPGEAATVRVSWPGAPVYGRAVLAGGWNVAERLVPMDQEVRA